MFGKKKDRHDTDLLGLREVTPDSAMRRAGGRESVGTAGEVERRDATGALEPSKGATGIDMGAGGEGTDIKP